MDNKKIDITNSRPYIHLPLVYSYISVNVLQGVYRQSTQILGTCKHDNSLT